MASENRVTMSKMRYREGVEKSPLYDSGGGNAQRGRNRENTSSVPSRSEK